MNQVQMVTYFLASLTLVAQIISVLGIAAIVIKKNRWFIEKFSVSYALVVTFTYAVAMVATVGSLYFSDVAGYTPCKFCWYQRIVMYPQTLMYLMALVTNDKKVHVYGLTLSLIGAAMAFYHYLLQIGVVHTTACSVVGFSISCSDRFTTTFGYITIPMMAFSAFSLIAVAWVFYLTAQISPTKKQ